MKLVICTLAICLSILASVLTTKELIRAEGKKIRSSVPKALAETLDGTGHQDSLAQKLDAINAQLGTLNRRLLSLEENAARQTSDLPSQATSEHVQALTKNGAGLSSALTRLDAVSGHLAKLTTYLDKSFEHLEETVTETAAPTKLNDSLEVMAKKIEDIDSYFTPLYAFLGLSYDPANNDLLAAYPSVDVRINELFMQLEAVRKDIASLREWLTPRNIEPTRYESN